MCTPTFYRSAYKETKSDTIVIKLRKRAYVDRALSGLQITSTVEWASVICPNCEDSCAISKSSIPTRAFNSRYVSVAVSEEGKVTKYTTGHDVPGRRYYKCPKCKQDVQSHVNSEGRANTIISSLIKKRNNVKIFQENVNKCSRINKDEILSLEGRLGNLNQSGHSAWMQEKKSILGAGIEVRHAGGPSPPVLAVGAYPGQVGQAAGEPRPQGPRPVTQQGNSGLRPHGAPGPRPAVQQGHPGTISETGEPPAWQRAPDIGRPRPVYDPRPYHTAKPPRPVVPS